MIRTGYSFRVAVGHVPDVVSRLKEVGWEVAPMADRSSTYGHVRWTKAAEKAGLRPAYGVEIGVTERLGVEKPGMDYWTFMARGDLRPLHDLIWRATLNAHQHKLDPCILYSDLAEWSEKLIAISGEAVLLGSIPQGARVNMGLSPATPVALAKAILTCGHPVVAMSNNKYPREEDREFYRVALGRHKASSQTYPMHILSDEEWMAAVRAPENVKQAALVMRELLLSQSTARQVRAELMSPEKSKTLREMCEEGAARLGVNLGDPVYAKRLDRELTLIAEKKFEDYFYIVADIVQYARTKMVVGPARGSSCGSLACYLLGITAVDPLKFDLVFERFIDVTRADLPDIDLDFSETERHLVFDYVREKYGHAHVARLGTVGTFKAKLVLNSIGASLKIPSSRINEVSNTVINRSFGDSRADSTIADTFQETELGKKFIKDFPEAEIASRLEWHPSNSGQHAAGVVVTASPILDHVAVDGRTGATMCDKKDAEELNLLKIDALGLTQLSIFERCLQLIGKPRRSEVLEAIPLDDQRAFDVLNEKRFSGIFQFTPGTSSTGLVESVLLLGGRMGHIEDIVSLTALVRPGPLGSGAAESWIRRRVGREPVTYPHDSMEPYLKTTLGIVAYQEQVMTIGREIGGLSWDDVTALRKAMSRSLGKEFFDQFGDKWKAGARSRAGLSEQDADKIWDDLCTYGMWAFNRSHSVAYGLVSYWCCWLKAHHPVEYAAAVLDSQLDPDKQVETLRELAAEGVGYVPVDPEKSTDRWVPAVRDGQKVLVGPLTNIRGIGPKTVMEIMNQRTLGKPLKPATEKKLREAKTPIDSLTPIADAVASFDRNIVSVPTPIAELPAGREIMVCAKVSKITPLDENNLARVMKRGGKVYTGPTNSVHLFFKDDTGEIFAKIGRFDFDRIGRRMLETAREGKSLYAVKGVVPPDFRMIKVKDVRHIGDVD